jgi:hypothetical protein
VAAKDCAFLNPRNKEGDTVRAPGDALERLRRNSPAATISAAQATKEPYAWPDKSTSPAALELEIQIGNQKIKVFRPAPNDGKGKNLPTDQQLAIALRAIPEVQRACTKAITLSPKPSPEAVQGKYIIAGDGGSGTIDLYPVHAQQTQQDFDNRVMHECGHNYAEKVYGNGPEGVQAWKIAFEADTQSPSWYAGFDGEDFPEFLILYNTVKGTPCEETAKQMYPNRWKKMDSY